jgi:hypothetical protein
MIVILARMKTFLGAIIWIVALGIGGRIQAQSASSPRPSPPQMKAHNPAAEIVEDEARALKAPTGFVGVKWLLNVDEVKALRPKARSSGKDDLFEAMEWLGRPAAVSYGFDGGLFVIAIVTMSNATPEDYEKTQKSLQTEYGNMPAPAKTAEFVLSSTYKQGRFSIMHILRPNKAEQVTIFRTK